MKGVKQDLNTAAILKQYQAGTAIRVLAVMFNTSRPRINAVLTGAGIDPSARKGTTWRGGQGYRDVAEYGVWDGY